MSVRGQRDAAAASTDADVGAGVPADLRWMRLAQSLAGFATGADGEARDSQLGPALAEILLATGGDFAVLARRDGDGLRCVAQAGAVDSRLSLGESIPLRWRPTASTLPYAVLVGTGATLEPIGEYLRAAGFRNAAVVAVGASAQTAAVLLLAWHTDSSHLTGELPLITTAVQPLVAVVMPSKPHPYWVERQPQLEHSQKLEALGSMAGMIAHDFNNLLTTILGYTSILKNSGRLLGDDAEFLNHVEEATHRAADLTARLLSFARGGVMRTGPLDLRAVIVDTLRLAEPALQHRIAVTSDLPVEPIAVDGDDGQLQQCILNILLNARDAMPDGGRVAISIEREPNSALLRIADDGPGMDPAVRERIFEPYFTTKPKGSGTGLGLSIAYGVVRGHGGQISVDSTPGAGTTFTMRFPTLDALPPASDVERMAAADRDLVLVVDDDDMVRRTTMHTVAHLGYNVVDAPGGRVAIDLVRARPDRFAVVLLDLVMPDLTGAQTFKELRAIRESLPIVICTGYAADAHLQDIASAPIAGLVHKPFTPERLSEVLEGLQVRKARR